MSDMVGNPEDRFSHDLDHIFQRKPTTVEMHHVDLMLTVLSPSSTVYAMQDLPLMMVYANVRILL